VVLQGAKMPAVLIETAFLSNADEAQKLNDPSFQNGIADGIVASIKHMQESQR
jgi:N-acetylmuramoyl-L-alanine amidase